MAWVVFRLRWALRRRSLARSGGLQRALFATVWLCWTLVGIAGGAFVAAQNDWTALALLFTAIYLFWVLAPLVVPALADNAVDPAKLAVFPLRDVDRVNGLLLGAVLSPTGLATFLTVSGAAFSAHEPVTARIGGPVVGLAFTIACAACSRAAQVLLVGVLATRIGRLVITVLAGIVAVATVLVQQRHVKQNPISAIGGASAVLDLLPGGWAATAITAARTSDWPRVVFELALLVAVTMLAWSLWMVDLRRRRTHSPSPRLHAPRRSQSSTGIRLIPLGFANAFTAAMWQQLRYYFFRSSAAIQMVMIVPIVGLVVSHGITESGLVVAGLMVVLFASTTVASNLLAFDDRGFSYLVAAGAPLRQVLAGKAAAPLLYIAPLLLVFLIVEAMITNQWGDVIPGTLAGIAGLLVATGVGAFTSVAAPLNQVNRGTGRFKAITYALLGLPIVFILIGLGAVIWTQYAEQMGSTGIGALLLAAAALFAGGCVELAGRRLARSPWKVGRALGVLD